MWRVGPIAVSSRCSTAYTVSGSLGSTRSPQYGQSVKGWSSTPTAVEDLTPLRRQGISQILSFAGIKPAALTPPVAFGVQRRQVGHRDLRRWLTAERATPFKVTVGIDELPVALDVAALPADDEQDEIVGVAGV
jgi:hypothetical protein